MRQGRRRLEGVDHELVAIVRLENNFVVDAPPERAWALLNDVPSVVPCMPGASLTDVVGPDAWKASLAVRLGPILLNFAVDVTREEADESALRVVLLAKGREVRGQGGAEARLESRLNSTDGGTLVSIVTDLTLRGAVAQQGRGVVPVVAAQLTEKFANCLAATLRADGT